MEMESTVDFRSQANKLDTSLLEEKKDDDPKTIFRLVVPEQERQPQRHERDTRGSSDNHSHDNMDDQSQKTEASVSFGSVVVREYERVIDSTNIYMGLTLGWDFNEYSKLLPPAEVEEEDDDGDKSSRPSPQKAAMKASASEDNKDDDASTRMKRTNGSERYGMLVRYGYKPKELRKETDQAAKFFKQRQREAARSLIVADERNKQQQNDKKNQKPKRLFGSAFRR